MTARRFVRRLARRLVLLAPLAATPLTWAGKARAVEREHHLGVDAGGSVFLIGDKSSADVGPGAGVHYAYGLSDALNLMIEGSWSLVALGEKAQSATTPNTRPSNLTHLDVGLGYVFDVLRWVPYATALAGGYALTGGTIGGTRVLPGVGVGGGLDYRIDRTWAAGVALRWHFFPTDASTYPSLMEAFARVECTWGW